MSKAKKVSLVKELNVPKLPKGSLPQSKGIDVEYPPYRYQQENVMYDPFQDRQPIEYTDDVDDDDFDDEVNVLGQQVKNAVNNYFNEREKVLYDPKKYLSTINPSHKSLNTDGPVLRGQIAKAQRDVNFDTNANAGVVYKPVPKKRVIKDTVENTNGGFQGNNFNLNGLRDAGQKKLTIAQVKQGYADPNTKTKVQQKATGNISKSTLMKTNPKPSSLNWYTIALREYKKQAQMENRVYSGRIRKGSPEYEDVMQIMQRLKQ